MDRDLKETVLDYVHMKNQQIIDQIILQLKQMEVDGETMEYIIKQVGMESQMYSEEEVIKLLIYCKDRFGGSELYDYTHDDEVKNWFEQFKKK